MTNLEHLGKVEAFLLSEAAWTMAHTVQDAREEIIALRAELKIHREADVELIRALAPKPD